MDGGAVTTNNGNVFSKTRITGIYGWLNFNYENVLTVTLPKALWKIYEKTKELETWFTLTDGRTLKFNAVLYGDENVKTEEDNVVITIDRPRTGKWSVSDGELDNDVNYALTGTTHEVSKGTTVKTYTSSYKLEEIDNLREYILKQGKKEVLIKSDSMEK